MPELDMMHEANRQALEDVIAWQVARTTNSSLIGRAWETSDPKQCQAFAEWLVDTVERLGFEIRVKE